MAFKLVIVVLLVLVVVSLFQALYVMLKGRRQRPADVEVPRPPAGVSAAVLGLLLVLLATGGDHAACTSVLSPVWPGLTAHRRRRRG